MDKQSLKNKQKLNIVFASHTHIGGPFVVGSHHLAREFSAMGHNILHMSSPISPFHVTKLNDEMVQQRFDLWTRSRLYEQKNHLVNFVPMSFVPWNISKKIYKANNYNILVNTLFPSPQSVLKNTFNTNTVDVLLVDQPNFVGIHKLLKPTVSIYRPTDLYGKMTGSSLIEKAEREIIDNSDAIVGTSEPVTSYWKGYFPNKESLTIENGVEFDHFTQKTEKPADLKEIKGYKAVYVGAIDERIDLKAFEILASKNPELNIIIIGPYQENVRKEFQYLDNIMLLGPKDYKNIPTYLRDSDVALLPFSDHEANNGRSPMKLYEYAASGLPVVVKKTTELARRNDDFIYFYEDTTEISEVVKEVLAMELDKDGISRSAKSYSWKEKAELLIDYIYNL